MRFTNNYPKSFSEKFVNAFRWIGVNSIIFIALTITFFTLGQLGYMKIKVAQTIATLTGLISITSIYKFLVFLLKIEPNEKSVEIHENSLTIEYPFPKRKRVIEFTQIDFIKYDKLSNNNKVSVGVKQDKSEFGMDFEFIELSSIDLQTWTALSDKKKIPLLIGYDIESKPIIKWGFLVPRIELDDVYVIRKNIANREIKIDESEWTSYVSTNSKIKFLGRVERINWKNDDNSTPEIQYALDTSFGIKSLDFIDGQIGVAYQKGKSPIEIMKIARDLTCEYKDIMDIK